MSSTSVSQSANPSSLYAIDKLSSTNFSSWKFRMQMILMDRGLWEIVDGTLVIPPLVANDQTSQVKVADWKKKDNSARAQIGLTVGSNELVHIKSAKSSHDAWTKICNVFEEKGLSAKLFLRRSSSLQE